MTVFTKYNVVAMVTTAKHQVPSSNRSKTEKQSYLLKIKEKIALVSLFFYFCSLSISFVPKYLAVVTISTARKNNNNNVMTTLKIA